jgi:DNA polymerase-3 subunit gamma/tau
MCGQDITTSLLRSAASTNRFSHAYLFYGGRGTGKTTAARILAKILNCQTRSVDPRFSQTGEPCNTCAACRAIDSNTCLDVIEIDAASNRGIDEIRNIQESIRTAPSHYRYKVFIIDEAHMLTTAAFNALLKTLEEPPAHGVLVLATTDYEKLPATIVSRTQRFLFRKIPKDTIYHRLLSVATTEGINIKTDALEIIAAAADGSLRDGLSLLDQARHLSPDSISADAVTSIIGRTHPRLIHDFTSALLAKEVARAHAIVQQLCDSGVYLPHFIKDTLSYLRSILALALNPDIRDSLSDTFTELQLEAMDGLIAMHSISDINTVTRALLDTYIQMRTVPLPLLALELFFSELHNKRSS